MDGSALRIVRASREQLPAIAELAAVIWRSYYPGIISPEQIEYMLARMYDLRTLEQELASGICFDQLLAENELVGLALLRMVPRDPTSNCTSSTFIQSASAKAPAAK